MYLSILKSSKADFMHLLALPGTGEEPSCLPTTITFPFSFQDVGWGVASEALASIPPEPLSPFLKFKNTRHNVTDS